MINRSMGIVFMLLFTCMSFTLLTGCGTSEKKLEEIEGRISALEEKGVPDSVLSSVKVYVYNVKAAKKGSNAGIIRKYADSMAIGIEQAESWYQKSMEEFKPYVESKKQELGEQKINLTGLQLKTVDSMFTLVDSLVQINWLIQAKNKVDKLDSIMPVLLENEKKASEIRNKLTGKWTDIHWVKPEDVNYKALDKRIYTFKKDGSFEGSESLKGQTTEFLKEDWHFLSWGKYDLKGDTIHLFIDREKCLRQIFIQWHINKKTWVKDEKPTYDSTITDGSKDRFITFDYLKENFRK
ncbi:MAG TPA: hypothetical protein VKY57_16505 [Chitinispirillaceae bacterium]|nr:hypothetical protein [Chitinispirillaceae bacterium]